MLREVLVLNLILCPIVILKRKHRQSNGDELGSLLISSMRDDKNLDLSMDEEYEDLRAELLAYHTALSSLIADDSGAEVVPPVGMPDTRRSMKTTPCWKLGGICVKYHLCKDLRFLTEIPGCKNNIEVCCFTWNKYETRDFTDKGIGNKGYPWSLTEQFGGRGLISPNDQDDSKTGLANASPMHSSADFSDKNDPYIYSSDEFKKKMMKYRRKHQSKRNKAPVVVIVKPNKQ